MSNEGTTTLSHFGSGLLGQSAVEGSLSRTANKGNARAVVLLFALAPLILIRVLRALRLLRGSPAGIVVAALVKRCSM
jgi:hypothetical protein